METFWVQAVTVTNTITTNNIAIDDTTPTTTTTYNGMIETSPPAVCRSHFLSRQMSGKLTPTNNSNINKTNTNDANNKITPKT